MGATAVAPVRPPQVQRGSLCTACCALPMARTYSKNALLCVVLRVRF